jgi:hypothetical protein
MTTAQLVPALLVPLVVWRVYVRLRRNIGRQPFRPGRLIFAAVFFSVVLTLVALAARHSLDLIRALGGGFALALVLGLVALRLTRFEVTAEGKFYIPNTAIGLGITLLFIGRLAYRIVVLMEASAAGSPQPPMFQSALTLFVFGITAGYYVTYSLAVFLRGRKQFAANAAV